VSGPVSVTFDYTSWVLRYPEFAAVSQPLAQLYFNEATIYCANHLNPVRTIAELTTFLNMLTAHIAQLNSPTTTSGSNSGTPPGRISDATEGSVSVSFEFLGTPGSQQWYAQTKYGIAYWQAILPYRLFRYKPLGTFQNVGCAPGLASSGGCPWQYPNTP
jgi:Protein of unknown function (DUF4054)